jgi:hypothetical protein
MIVTCEQCGMRFDDEFRLAICPHTPFAMRVTVTLANGRTKTCHSVEEIDRFMAEGK